MNNFVFTILCAFVVFISVFFMSYVKPILEEKLKNIQDERLVKAIEKAVKAAEQTIPTGFMRKEDVLRFIHEWLEKNNISITEKQLDKLIEAAVYQINNENIMMTIPMNLDKMIEDVVKEEKELGE